MIGEYSLYGIYLPWLLVLAGVALALSWVARKALAAIGFYRLVWHPALFDLALFVVILYGLNLVSPFIIR